MPVGRLIFVLTCLAAFLVLFCGLSAIFSYSHQPSPGSSRQSGLGAFFSFHSPSSLFPPSAIISLTDDNSTFFLARPAAFGPLLPSDGLSGQLWVGKGFGEDDDSSQDGLSAGAEPELGCSDAPGWDDGHDGPGNNVVHDRANKVKRYMRADRSHAELEKEAAGRSNGASTDGPTDMTAGAPPEDDGTDDYMLHTSDVVTVAQESDPKHEPQHADIQSLQEGAEIAGKVVLLSRGGCGFLDKVKWVQRRGGLALIVGDDTRGRGLVTMYARGDTSNVSIPSIFTSFTTAHLLSSLVPGDRHSAALDAGIDGENGKTILAGPTFTPAADGPAPTTTARPSKASRAQADEAAQHDDGGWLDWIVTPFGRSSSSAGWDEDSRRPPSSGRLDWVLVRDRTAPDESPAAKGALGRSTGPAEGKSVATGHADDFVIGVQDWRDPDLVGHDSAKSEHSKSLRLQSSSTGRVAAPSRSPASGIITPGSGEYADPPKDKTKAVSPDVGSIESEGQDSNTWLGRLSWPGDKEPGSGQVSRDFKPKEKKAAGLVNGKHDGLWVTLTPTSMSTSPFFDTLLVLVVSPLITLTVVYALLLLRLRIRRRRWRAPKSVVERLPVRTYHTVSSSSSLAGARYSSPDTTTSPATPATPLLQSQSIPASRQRVRSQTTSDLSERLEMARTWPVGAHDASAVPAPAAKAPAPVESSRRYRGRQLECVVCLEEYVDGVSRVMSLPCGHEFHAECITPWLVNRRRFCPLCKVDIVRSMANRTDTDTAAEPYRDHPGADDDDELHERDVDGSGSSDDDGAHDPDLTVPDRASHDEEEPAAGPAPAKHPGRAGRHPDD